MSATRYFALFLSLFLVLGDAFANSLTDSESPPRQFSPPFPFSADQLWGRLLVLATTSSQDLSLREVEDVLGVRLKPVLTQPCCKDLAKQDSYSAKHGIDWYFNVSFTVGADNTKFLAFQYAVNKYGMTDGAPPSEVCINVDRAVSSLTAKGYRVTNKPNWIDGSTIWFEEKKDRSVRLGYDVGSKCVNEVLLHFSER